MCDEDHRGVVIGIGNRFRSDDSVGLAVLDAARSRLPSCAEPVESNGDAVGLMASWEGADLVVLIDAVRSGGKPGTIYRFDGSNPLPSRFFRAASSHVLGLGEALELARTLGRLPRRVVVVGVEAGELEYGSALSPPVAAAIDRAADLVARAVSILHRGAGDTERGIRYG